MSEESFRLERDGAVAIVTVDRPPVNALRFADYDALRRIIHRLSHDTSVHAIVLTGAGSRAFVGGHDVNEFVVFDFDGATELLTKPRLLFEALIDCEVPIICALNGTAVGSGLAIASLCDIRLAAPHARFGLPEIDRGVLGGAKAIQRLIPQGLARWMMFTGRRIDAEKGLAVGFVDEIVAADDLERTARALAKEIAGKNPVAIRLARVGMNRIEDMSWKDAYTHECTLTAQVRRSARASEEAAAYVGHDRGVGAG